MGACGSVRDQTGNDNDIQSQQKYGINSADFQLEKSEVS